MSNKSVLCPACRSSTELVETIDRDFFARCIHTYRCGTRGPMSITPEGAMTAWKRIASSLFQRDRVGEWATHVFGLEVLKNIPERGLRVLEEALELAQACAVDRDTAHRLVDYVFDRPKSDIAQEIAGCLVTLLALGFASDVDIDEAFSAEFERINTPRVIEKIRRRQQEKHEV